MKKVRFTLLIFLFLSTLSVIAADKVEKVVGTIAEKATAGRFGPDGNNYYGFQTYQRTLNIDASQSQFENLVLKMRVFIDNLDHPGDISFIQQAGFAMIELANEQTPVDTYVQWGIKSLNLQHGNISHLLVPTYPTVHLPNSILRVYPERKDFTSDLIAGLPVIVTSHRGNSAFNISPKNEFWGAFEPVINYTYDNEKITPYRYSVYLNEAQVKVDFAPSHQSGVYNFQFEELANQLIINTRNGKLKATSNGVSGYQLIGQGPTKVYLYLEAEQPMTCTGALNNNEINFRQTEVEGKNKALVICFQQMKINIRYGISFISEEQAKKNLEREIKTYSVDKIAKTGKEKWNNVLSKIQIEGGNESEKTVFYTSLYRTYERMINLSEDSNYYSAFDNKIHDDEGSPFYTDDWVWDTYRATHPLRTLIEPDMESDMVNSYVRMSQQTKEGWMPTFPEVTGDSHRMNGNHAVAVVWDAYSKGLRGYDLEAAYNACKGALTEKSLLPWKRIPNTELDVFYYCTGKYVFYSQLPDQTGNVGQYSMANEPSFHIPYLYNYAGQPWKTQKRIRDLLNQWFRNDLMGVPGDEDGGGMSAFVVFSAMGFYPVTPGSATYNIGSPLFENIKIDLGNNHIFKITAKNASKENKYIQSAKLNGRAWNKPWFSHEDIKNGGTLELMMGDKANQNWGGRAEDAPPSAEVWVIPLPKSVP